MCGSANISLGRGFHADRLLAVCLAMYKAVTWWWALEESHWLIRCETISAGSLSPWPQTNQSFPRNVEVLFDLETVFQGEIFQDGEKAITVEDLSVSCQVEAYHIKWQENLQRQPGAWQSPFSSSGPLGCRKQWGSHPLSWS